MVDEMKAIENDYFKKMYCVHCFLVNDTRTINQLRFTYRVLNFTILID